MKQDKALVNSERVVFGLSTHKLHKKRKSKMTSTRTVNISLTNIQDQVAALLYAMQFADTNEEITSVEFGEIHTDKKGQYIVPVSFGIKKEGGDKVKK